jgi:hypothetical protein
MHFKCCSLRLEAPPISFVSQTCLTVCRMRINRHGGYPVQRHAVLSIANWWLHMLELKKNITEKYEWNNAVKTWWKFPETKIPSKPNWLRGRTLYIESKNIMCTVLQLLHNNFKKGRVAQSRFMFVPWSWESTWNTRRSSSGVMSWWTCNIKHKCSFLSIFSPFCFRNFLICYFFGCSVHAHTKGVFRPTKKGISRIKEQNHKTGHSKQIKSHTKRVNVETSRGNNYHTWELLCRARANKTFFPTSDSFSFWQYYESIFTK